MNKTYLGIGIVTVAMVAGVYFVVSRPVPSGSSNTAVTSAEVTATSIEKVLPNNVFQTHFLVPTVFSGT